MSRLYFHSPSGEAELLGSERHWLGGLASDLAAGVLSLGSTFHVDRLTELLSPKHYLHGRDTNTPGWILAWRRDFESAFRLGWDDSLLVWRGKDLSTFTLQLNTAMQLGNDAVKLAARLHGQCEIHAWVDGPNRAWLADMMQAGLDSGIYRKGFWYEPNSDGEKKWQSQGWPEVIALLRARDDEPVVTSYSVCDSFPNSLFGDWNSRRPDGVDEDDHADAWYDLDTAEKWSMAMPNLRECPGHLELTPDDWNTYRFGHKLSVLDLFGDDYQERLDAATGHGDGGDDE